MAVDEYLLELCRGRGADAALRFYEWKPPAVSLGHSQPFDLLDLPACLDQGIDVVRRITGGGALLHWQELTYCFVIRRDAAPAGARPREMAGAVSRALTTGLAAMGVRASSVTRASRAADASGGRPPASGLCFASGAENEIEVSGRKLAGCAHKLTREAFFSHGSVMTGPRHVYLCRLVRPGDARRVDDPAESGARDLAERSTSLSELLTEAPSAGEMESAFKSAFESEFGLRFRPAELCRAGAALVEARAVEKRSALASAVRAVELTEGAR